MKQETINIIKNHPVYKQVLADSFGGVMYDVANQGKYDAEEIVSLWDSLTPDQQNFCSDGILKGAMNFLKGDY